MTDAMLSEPAVAALSDWLQATYGNQHPPIVQARVLAYIVALWLRRHPWPKLNAAASACGCTPSAISQATAMLLARGLINVSVSTRPGKTLQRTYAPTDRTLDVMHSLRLPSRASGLT